MIATFLVLMIGHFIADYPLQGDFIGKFKSWKVPSPTGELLWPHLLTAHAAIHAGAVWLITGNPYMAITEFVAHWLIDLAKCSGLLNFHQDQVVHLYCKLLYAFG